MPNLTIYNGLLTYQYLEQYDLDTGIATGVIKPNDPSDPDYIPGVVDETLCPPRTTRWVPGDYVCEESAAYTTGFSLGFES